MTSTPHDFGTSIQVGRPKPVTSSADLPHHGPWSRHVWPCPFFYEGNWRDGRADGRGVDRCTCGAGFPEASLPQSLMTVSDAGETMFTSEYVDALRAELAPRVVSSVAELDALQVETVFRTDRGAIWEVIDPTTDGTEFRYASTGYKDRYQSKTFDGELPATVLYAPPVVGTGETGRTTDAEN